MRARPSEFDRLRDTIRQMRQETASGYSAPSGGNGDAQRMLTDRLGSLQRAVECLSETLEDEMSALRSSNAAQADQIKLLTSQLADSSALRTEVSDLRRELKGAVGALKSGELSRLVPQLAELQAELEATRAAQTDERRGAAAERKQLSEEISNLRQWRAETVHPLLEASERSRATQREVVDGALPQILDRVGLIEAEAATWSQVRDRVAETERTLGTVGAEVSSVTGQVLQLTDVHSYAVGSLEAGLGRIRDAAQHRDADIDEQMHATAAELEKASGPLSSANPQAEDASSLLAPLTPFFLLPS
jgi:chromosome segregation ATPase